MENKTQRPNSGWPIKEIIVAGASLALAFLTFYNIEYIDKKFDKYLERERVKIEEMVKQSEYRKSLYEKVFGANGLADLNRDGVVSFIEQIDAHERAGSLSHSIGRVYFRDPSIEGLEKAIRSYNSAVPDRKNFQ